jgi:hypothetical protein
MFIGHYAVGLGAKKLIPELNLAWLIFACHLLDLIWPILVMFGLEHVVVEPGATVMTPLNFISYPYSHSLIMAVFYAVVYALFLKRYNLTNKSLWIIGAVVLSHWFLDYVTHRPDMPIFFNSFKFGLGLWNYKAVTVITETIMFSTGIILYLKSRHKVTKKQNIAFWSMIGFLSILYISNIFAPTPPINTPVEVIAGSGLALWIIVYWAYFADKKLTNKN